MKIVENSHPWKKLKVVNDSYFNELGLNIDNIDEAVLKDVKNASIKAIKDYKQINGKPPLLKNNEKLKLKNISIPDNLKLQSHGYCSGCPKYIREVDPSFLGCQLNCQYCLIVSNKSIQKDVKIYDNYDIWFGKQLSENRIKDKNQNGILYYWSPKTDSLSPEMIKSGLAQSILNVFIDHVNSEQKRMNGRCADTLLIISKAGVQELTTQCPNGETVLELMKKIPDNIQVCGSLNYLNNSNELREALEPGTRCEEDRLKFLVTLQKNKILASGLLFQPILYPFLPDKDYFHNLKQKIGIDRIYIDILTSNINSISVTNQIIGWYFPEAEKQLWNSYLPQTAPEKSGNRRSIDIDLQRKVFEKVIFMAKSAGIEDVTYCRFSQQTIGLPKLEYDNYENNGCMAYVSPTPENIRIKRLNQRNS